MSITVYSKTGCAPCETLRYWLVKKNIIYKEKDILKSDFRIAPTIDIDGQIIEGLNLRALVSLLGI